MTIKTKKPLAIIAAVVLTLLLAVSTAVPALAAETADTTTVSNPQIVYDEPDLGEDDTSDNGITLPEAPAKEGYAFQGWRVNGGSELYNAGDVVLKDGSKKCICNRCTKQLPAQRQTITVQVLSQKMSGTC